MTLAQVYDHLLGVGMADTINFSDYLQTLCLRLPELQLGRLHVILTCDSVVTTMGIDDVSKLGMVVAELVSNSYNHGFPDGRSGTIAVVLASSLGRATLTIIDDGVGFDVTAPDSRHGLTLARRLMARMDGGSLNVASDLGTAWTLKFDCLATGIN